MVWGRIENSVRKRQGQKPFDRMRFGNGGAGMALKGFPAQSHRLVILPDRSFVCPRTQAAGRRAHLSELFGMP